jgi:ssDNA-binding Zn-finger/Zn-ribbon topoisomerase 1
MKDNQPVSIICPECIPTVKLIIKTNKRDQSQFLGCPNWPDCDHTEEIPISIKLRERGEKSLFDDWLNE